MRKILLVLGITIAASVQVSEALDIFKSEIVYKQNKWKVNELGNGQTNVQGTVTTLLMPKQWQIKSQEAVIAQNGTTSVTLSEGTYKELNFTGDNAALIKVKLGEGKILTGRLNSKDWSLSFQFTDGWIVPSAFVVEIENEIDRQQTIYLSQVYQ